MEGTDLYTHAQLFLCTIYQVAPSQNVEFEIIIKSVFFVHRGDRMH